MTPGATIEPTARVSLHPKVRLRDDAASGKKMLVFPESVLLLNATGAAIVELCDGRTVEELCLALTERFQSPEAQLRAEAITYLSRLAERGVLVLAP